jgi:hypothetical protein
MITVARIEIQFIKKVNNRYFAIRGRTREVGGRIFDTNKRNTTNDSRIDMPNVTFSPDKRFRERSKDNSLVRKSMEKSHLEKEIEITNITGRK